MVESRKVHKYYYVHGIKVFNKSRGTNKCQLNGHDSISLTSMVLLLLNETEHIDDIVLQDELEYLAMWLYCKQRLNNATMDRIMGKFGQIEQYVNLLGLGMRYRVWPGYEPETFVNTHFCCEFYTVKEEGLLSE